MVIPGPHWRIGPRRPTWLRVLSAIGAKAVLVIGLLAATVVVIVAEVLLCGGCHEPINPQGQYRSYVPPTETQP